MGTRLGVDEAERGHGQSIVRREMVEEAAFMSIGEDLVVDVLEYLRGQDLDLKAHLVMNAVGTRQTAGVFIICAATCDCDRQVPKTIARITASIFLIALPSVSFAFAACFTLYDSAIGKRADEAKRRKQ